MALGKPKSNCTSTYGACQPFPFLLNDKGGGGGQGGKLFASAFTSSTVSQTLGLVPSSIGPDVFSQNFPTSFCSSHKKGLEVILKLEGASNETFIPTSCQRSKQKDLQLERTENLQTNKIKVKFVQFPNI